MIILEVTDDKFGKIMKAISEIGKHSECLAAMFEDLTEDSEYNSLFSNTMLFLLNISFTFSLSTLPLPCFILETANSHSFLLKCCP